MKRILWAALALVSSACAAPLPQPPAAEPVAPPAPPPPPAAAPAPAPPPVAEAPAPAPAAPASGPCPAGMALIPGGEYVFGLLKEKITVKPFCLDVNETTADAYGACVKAGKCDDKFVTVCEPSTFGKSGQG